MVRERQNGLWSLTVGGSWVIGIEDWFSRDGWKDTRDSRREIIFLRPNGGRAEQIISGVGHLEMYCHQIRVAQVGETLLENGVRVIQLAVSPQISSIEIDPVVDQEIERWVSGSSEGEDLCREIKSYCDQRGMTVKQQAAISFLVYVRKKGANRWG